LHQGFSDDSSNNAGEKTLLLAGCVARHHVWADFCFAWAAALASPPSVEYFKMREARQRIKQFKGWRITDCNAKIRLLANVIAEHRPNVVATYISRREFDEIVRPIIPYMMRHPYNVLFYTLIAKLAEWQFNERVPGKTEWVFDDQGAVGVETVTLYGEMKSLQPPHLRDKWGGIPAFRSDIEVLPLQAADLVAWHRRRRVDCPDEKVSELATAVIEDLTYGDVPIPRVYLSEIARAMAKVPGVFSIHKKPRNYKPGMSAGEAYGEKKQDK
jgi:hypothetical protein